MRGLKSEIPSHDLITFGGWWQGVVRGISKTKEDAQWAFHKTEFYIDMCEKEKG